LRAYPIWAIVLLLLGWAVIAVTLVYAVDLLLPALTGEIYGRWILLATTGAVATIGIALGLALIAIAGAGRRGKTGRWKLWAKLLLVLGGALCICIPLLLVAAGQFGSVFAGILLFFGWIPLLIGALLILAALIWGRRSLRRESDVAA
jgi:hypothetical protein